MAQFVGLHVETDKKGEVGVIQSSFGTSGKFRVHFPAGTEARDGDKLFLRFRRYANDPDKGIHQTSTLPKARMGTRVANSKKEKKPPGSASSRGKQGQQSKKAASPNNTTKNDKVPAKTIPDGKVKSSELTGEISALKGEVLDNGKHTVAIVSGLFGPE
eukprot:1302122-Ditylum_brightwellii.AAC.1